MNWLTAILIFTSLSVKAPLDPNPADYELAYGISQGTNLHIENQLERENGRNFRDEIYWKTIETNHLYIREKYINKRSKKLQYNQMDIRYKQGKYTVGYALKHIGPTLKPQNHLITGYKFANFQIPAIITNAQITGEMEISTNFSNIDIATYNKLKLGDWFILARYEKQGNQRQDYQLKIGLEINLPIREK